MVDLGTLISQYGYLAVFLGTLVEGETFVVLAAVAASNGYLELLPVIAMATIGSFTSYQFCFQVGRRIGPRMLRGKDAQGSASKVRALAERYPALIIIGIHFLYGLRTVGLVVIGMSGVGGWRFFWLNFLGSLIWATTIASLGYLFGNVLHALAGHFDRYGVIVAIALVVLAIGGWLARRHFMPR